MRLSLQGVLELPGLPWALLAAPVPGSLLLILKRRSLLLMMLDNQRVSPRLPPSPPPHFFVAIFSKRDRYFKLDRVLFE